MHLTPAPRSIPRRARGLRLIQGCVAMALGVLIVGCTTTSSAPGGPTATAAGAPRSPNPLATFSPAAALDGTFDSKVFRPAFRLKLPADWIAAERDAAAFQLYFGQDERYEITIDHTYQRAETADTAMARLLAAPSLTAQGAPQPITIGGKTGRTVIVDASDPVLWSDSGYHVNVANLRVRLVTIPVDGGQTVSIFIVANTGAADFAAVDQIALRILATLEWVAA